MRERIQGIEGLRVLAMVFIASWLSGVGPFHGGFVGFDVGFVIAGFFASRHITQRADLAPRAFFVDIVAYRLRRVVPLTALISILTGGFIIVVYGYSHLDAFMSDARSVILFYANFQLHSGSNHPVSSTLSSSPFAQFWTISLLQQCVLVWAAIYYWVRHRASQKVTQTVFLSAMAVAILMSGELHYYTPISSILAFAVGAMYSWYHERNEAQVTAMHDVLALAGLAFITAMALTLHSDKSYNGFIGVALALSTVAIIAAWAPDGAGRLERFFEFKPLSALGKYTFAFYLWLFPGLVVLSNARHEDLSTGWRLNLLLAAAVLAFFSHHLIEVPVLRWLDPNDDRVSDDLDFKITYRGTAILITITVLMSFGFANMSHYRAVTAFKAPPPTALQLAFPAIDESSFYPTMPELRQEIRKSALAGSRVSIGGFLPGDSNLADDADSHVFTDCTARGNDETARVCHVGNPNAEPTVLVIGDGQAVAIAASLQPLAVAKKATMFVASRHGCRNNIAFDHFDNDRAQACVAWHRNLNGVIQTVKPDVIVLSSSERNPRSGESDNKEWTKGHSDFVKGLSEVAPGVRIIDVGGWVYRLNDPAECLKVTKTIKKTLASCATPQKKAVNVTRVKLRHQVDKDNDIAFINISKYFCTKTICPAIVGGVATMANQGVPSQSYMRYITKAVAPELTKIMDIARAHAALTKESPPK